MQHRRWASLALLGWVLWVQAYVLPTENPTLEKEVHGAWVRSATFDSMQACADKDAALKAGKPEIIYKGELKVRVRYRCLAEKDDPNTVA